MLKKLVALGVGAALSVSITAPLGGCDYRRDELRVACTTESEADAFERLAVAPYRATHPGAAIKVTYLFRDDKQPQDIDAAKSRYVEKELATSDMFVGLSAAAVSDLADSGAVEQLDKRVADDRRLAAGMARPVVSLLKGAGAGHFYALTPTFGSMALAYNRSMFDAAGIKPPTGTLTWQEALRLGESVASRTSSNTAAFSFGPEGYSDFQSTFLQQVPSAGVYVFDGGRIETGGRFRELWKLFMDAERTHALSKDGDAFWRGESALALLYNGQVDDPATYQSATNYSKFDWDLMPTPVFDKEHPVSYADVQDAMVLSSRSPHKDEAWDLMAFLAGPNYARQLVRRQGAPFAFSLPSNGTTAVVDSLRSRIDKQHEAFYAHPAPRPRRASHNDVGDVLSMRLLQKLMVDSVNGRVDAQKAADVLSAKGPELYQLRTTVNMNDDSAMLKLIEY